MSFTLMTLLVAGGMFIAVLAFLEVGRRIGRAVKGKEGKEGGAGSTLVQLMQRSMACWGCSSHLRSQVLPHDLKPGGILLLKRLMRSAPPICGLTYFLQRHRQL
jgi:hypothetical protein